MSQPYLGQIIATAFNFAPEGYQMCDGSLLSIAENDALFDLLGTTYGGDGMTTFGVPDLRSRVPIHFGSGAGLSSYVLGQTGGTESVTLTASQMPAHTHGLQASSSASAIGPSGEYFGTPADKSLYTASSASGTMGDIVDAAGGSQGHENRQPFQVINYVIALIGIFPSQN